jgi:hypothetical protein
MTVEAFIICWNEIETIHLTIKHYKRFCDKITIYDNHSDDGTAEKAKELGCDVVKFGIKGVLDDTEYLQVKNLCWKSSTADWVIVCDADEILDINLRTLHMAKNNGYTIFNTYGWNVFSNDMPVDSFYDITAGVFDKDFSKKVIFNPKEVKSINYVYGCHVSNPKGNLRYYPEKITLFHYRNIGGVDRLIKRHNQYRSRLSAKNKRMGLGCHYMYNDDRRINDWNESLKKSIPYSNGMDKLPI